MKNAAYLLAAALLGATALSGTVSAQGAPQTVSLAKVDVTKLATGYRSSKVVGSTVVNDANETVGKIDDLLVAPDGRALFAVMSVGGFLGVGDRLVVVPFDNLKMASNKVLLPGATKDQLKLLPEFKYAKG